MGIIAKLGRADLVIFSHSREEKTPSYQEVRLLIGR